MSNKSINKENKTDGILSTLMDEIGVKTIPELAKKLNYGAQAIYKWIERDSIPVENVYKKNPYINRKFLLKGEKPVFKSHYYHKKNVIEIPDQRIIPYYPEVSASAGDGLIPLENKDVIPLAFYQNWLQLIGLNSAGMVIIRARGVSMYPQILDGDYLFVDTTQHHPRKERPYVIRLGDQILVKYVYELKKEAEYLISSVNKEIYQPEIIITAEQGEDFKILGEVQHIQRTL